MSHKVNCNPQLSLNEHFRELARFHSSIYKHDAPALRLSCIFEHVGETLINTILIRSIPQTLF